MRNQLLSFDFVLIMFLCKGPVHLRLGQSGSAGRSGGAAQGSNRAAQGSGRSGGAAQGSGRSGRSGSAVQMSSRGAGAVSAPRQSASSSVVKSEVEPVPGPSWAPTVDYPINVGGSVLAVVTLDSDDESEGEEMSLGLLPSGECMDIHPQLRAEGREILVERGRGSDELRAIIRGRQGKNNVATRQTATGSTEQGAHQVLPIPDYADYVKDSEISLDDVSDGEFVDNTSLSLGEAVPTNEFSAAVARATEVSTAETRDAAAAKAAAAYAARAAASNAAAAAERAAAAAAEKAAQVTEGEGIMQEYDDDDDDEWMAG